MAKKKRKAKHPRHSGVQCPACGERLFSMSPHDFHYCSCQTTFVDGGRSYLRYGWSGETTPREIRFTERLDGPYPERLSKNNEDL